MKFIGLYIALFFCFKAKSQDTLFYKNAGKLTVVLKEISQTEIKYQKFEMQDGPLFIISKNDIEKITYKNGFTEVIQPLPVATVQPQIIYRTAPFYKERIRYSDTKVKYRDLVYLAHDHKDSKRQPELSQMALSLKRLKMNRDGTRTGAIIFGGIAIAGTALYGVVSAFGGGDETELIGPPAVSALLAIALTSLAITFDIKLRQKRNAFVNLYNQ